MDGLPNWQGTRVAPIPQEEHVNGLAKTLIIIAIIGAINWGLIGFFNFNLVDAIFGGGAREETSALSRVIYAIVGLCGLVALVALPKLHIEGPIFRPGAHRPV
jgi:uncharacterized membrane protein YuzA (DUF378 family)